MVSVVLVEAALPPSQEERVIDIINGFGSSEEAKQFCEAYNADNAPGTQGEGVDWFLYAFIQEED